MPAVLVCHTGLKPFFTEGKTYEIVNETDYAYLIHDDEVMCPNHFLTKKPDCDGHSFKTFMTLKGDK